MVKAQQKYFCDRHTSHFKIKYTCRRSADVAYLTRVSLSVTVMEPSGNPENGERTEDAAENPEEDKKTSKQVQLEQVPRMAAARKVLDISRGRQEGEKVLQKFEIEN